MSDNTTKGTVRHHVEDDHGNEYIVVISFYEVDNPGKYSGPWEDSWPAHHDLDWSVEDTGGAPDSVIAKITSMDVQQLVNQYKEDYADYFIDEDMDA